MAEGHAAPASPRMTVGEFQAFDDGTETRHELVGGRPVAMSPPSPRHAFITANIIRALDRKLKPPCRPFGGGGVARSDDGDEYRLPDVFVSCVPVPKTYFAEPRLLVEVLSPSTAKEDRTEKLDFYKGFPSAEAVLFVWQEPRRVELHLRREDGWLVTPTIGQGTVALGGLGVTLSLDEIYADL